MNKQVLNTREFLAKEIDISLIMLHAIHKTLEQVDILVSNNQALRIQHNV